MTPEIKTIEELALHLTGQTEIETNRHWVNTSPDWACPCCKRTKLHIARPLQNNRLKGALVDHHDHLANYADKKLSDLVKEAGRQEVTESEGRFKNQKIKPFIVRFDRTLICEDCNNADPAAKAAITDICPFFSFSPEDITYFIKPTKHSPHTIDIERAIELYDRESKTYEFRKSLCETLLSRLVINARAWGDQSQLPSSSHYVTAQKIRDKCDTSTEELTTLLKNAPNFGPRLISETLHLIEAEAHGAASTSMSAKQAKRARKKRLKIERLKKKTEEGYFNHNQPWKKDDITALKSAYEKDPKIEPLTLRFGRTSGSIKAKLKTLGFEIK